jgi:pilus assembly protein Flp/PilA
LNDVLQVQQPRPLELGPGSLQKSCLLHPCRDFLIDESGQDMVEYALVAALIGLVAISAVRGLGTTISSAYSSVASNLTSNT